MELPSVPVHSYHMMVSNRDYVVDSVERCLKPYGYFPRAKDQEVPPDAGRFRFYMSHFHKGWISLTDSGYFAQEELAKRSSEYLPGKVLYVWCDPNEAWGYQFYDQGALQAEFVSDMWELHREWFEEEPSPEEVGRFSGAPEVMKANFGKLGFSLREMQEVYARPPEDAMRSLKDFGEQVQLENAVMGFEAIDGLPPFEKLGPKGFIELDFYERYKVDLDRAEAEEGAEDGQADDGGVVLI